MEMIVQKLIAKIKTKKFTNLDEKIVVEKINEFLKKNPKIKINSLTEKSAEFKKIIKFVKQEMHRSYGAFQSNVSKRDRLFSEFKKNPSEEVKNKILLTHSSTRERLEFYDELKQDFSFIEGKSILDLGAGLNPLMFDSNKIIAVEFNKDDVDFLNEYFKIKNSKSKAVLIDLKKKENIEKLKDFKFDVVFAWKLFDLLNSDVIEAILKLDATIIVSFSTKTIGNKEMNVPKRKWFEKRLDEMNLKYTINQYENEIFYVIKLQ